MPPPPAEAAGLLEADTRTPAHVLVGYLLSFLLGLIGAMVGAYTGWLWGEGLIPIAAAVAGFTLCFSIAFCLLGPGEFHYTRFSSNMKPPEMERVRTLGLLTFELYVTVHRVKNLFTADIIVGLLGADRNSYVEAKVGRLTDGNFSVQRNPVKRTCVQASGVFEETFHFTVSPTDDTIRFLLYDQDIFQDGLVGMCDVNITDQVISQCFPQRKAFRLVHSGGPANVDVDERDPSELAGTLVASFMPGDDFPAFAAKRAESRRPHAFQRLKSAQTQLLGKLESSGQYGTWATMKV